MIKRVVGLGLLALIASTGCATMRQQAVDTATDGVQASPATMDPLMRETCEAGGWLETSSPCEIETP